MKRRFFQKRTVALIAVLGPLLALLVYVSLSSGPLAPVPVVLAPVENRELSPALFGIGTVEARYTYKIGPTYAGRILKLGVDVGDQVKAGETLGEMDPVDLDERLGAQKAQVKRAEAQLSETEARKEYALTQAVRYEELLKARSTSEELATTRRQELQIAEAGLAVAREELSRAIAEQKALEAQRRNLLLLAPVDGWIVARNAEPGTTLVAGQAVVEIVDPRSLWVNVRFDQIRAQGLAAGLEARILLRSQRGVEQMGHVLRVEPLADAVTEETLAKVVFEELPEPLPPIGELAEVTLALPKLPPAPLIPSSAVLRKNGTLGVWRVRDGALEYTPVVLGASDLEGSVQVKEGLKVADRLVIYSANALTERSRIHVVEKIPGVKP